MWGLVTGGERQHKWQLIAGNRFNETPVISDSLHQILQFTRFHESMFFPSLISLAFLNWNSFNFKKLCA